MGAGWFADIISLTGQNLNSDYSYLKLPVFKCLEFECGQSCLIILNIYRPPGPAITFFSELQDILYYISTLPNDMGLMGDFNLRIYSSSSHAVTSDGLLMLWNSFLDFAVEH